MIEYRYIKKGGVGICYCLVRTNIRWIIRIPAKLKDALGTTPIIMKGNGPYLVIYSQERASEVIRNRFASLIDEGGDEDNPDMDKLRDITSNAQNAEEDKQGRVKLDGTLVSYAGLKKNVVTIGMVDRAEIWSAEAWESRKKNKKA